MKVAGIPISFILDLVGDAGSGGDPDLSQERVEGFLKILHSNKTHWFTVHPLLYRWEMPQLIRWLDHLLANPSRLSGFRFHQPCLVFGRVDQAMPLTLFRFSLHFPAAPCWWAGSAGSPWTLQVECTAREIQEVTTLLKGWVHRFPSRHQAVDWPQQVYYQER